MGVPFSSALRCTPSGDRTDRNRDLMQHCLDWSSQEHISKNLNSFVGVGVAWATQLRTLIQRVAIHRGAYPSGRAMKAFTCEWFFLALHFCFMWAVKQGIINPYLVTCLLHINCIIAGMSFLQFRSLANNSKCSFTSISGFICGRIMGVVAISKKVEGVAHH